MDGNTIHIQYIPYIVFINVQGNIRRSYRANNANCNGYHRRLVTRSATAFTLGPVREFFFIFFYYRITSGNASSSTWPSWPTSRSREHVTSKSVDKLDDDPVSLSLSVAHWLHALLVWRNCSCLILLLMLVDCFSYTSCAIHHKDPLHAKQFTMLSLGQLRLHSLSYALFAKWNSS